MTRVLEIDFIPRVVEAIRTLGYRPTQDPSRIPNRRFWRDDPASLVRGLRYRPDILVEHGGNFAIVEIKTSPVLLGGVIQAHHYAEYFGESVIICVPDDVFPEIPGSVRALANDRHVRLCPLAKIGDVLRDLLS